MLGHIDEIENGASLHADVCVIGSSLAGIEAARFLSARGLSVTVAEGGNRHFDPQAQELGRTINVGRKLITPDDYRGITSYLPEEVRGHNRLRRYGGNSTVWTGKWRRFDAFELRGRSHVPHSEWPISYETLLEEYRAIERDYEHHDFAAFEQSSGFSTLKRRLAPAGIEPHYHFWEASAYRPVEAHAKELETSEQVRIVLGANAVELLPGASGETVGKLRCRSLTGREVHIEARFFLLAMGGLETPRLLLASRRFHPDGLGNEHDLVGRFFMDHPKIKAGKLWPGPAFDTIPGGGADFPRPRFKVGLALAPEVQERERLLHHTMQFSYLKDTQHEVLASAAGRGKPLMAAKAALRLVASAEQRGRALRAARGERQKLKTSFLFEQAPNPDSRVTLSGETDGLGMPRLKVNWQLTELDRKGFSKTISLLGRSLEEAGIGRLEFEGGPPTIDDTFDSYHHMGTTRMAASPGEGVVDANGKLFAATNVFIGSSAVFPTGHSYGPTLTIVAVTRRACREIARLARAGAGRAVSDAADDDGADTGAGSDAPRAANSAP